MSNRWPAISEPEQTVESMHNTILELKQMVEILSQQRGNKLNHAVTFQDLLDRGLITENHIDTDDNLPANQLADFGTDLDSLEASIAAISVDPLIQTTSGSDAAAPASGTVSYYTKDSQLWSRSPTGLPQMIRRRYSGNMTLTTADDYETIMENHEGFATITLANGNYTVSSLVFQNVGPLTIAAATIGGANILVTSRITVNNSMVTFFGVDFESQAGATSFFRGAHAYTEFKDCTFDHDQAGAGVLWGISGGITRFDADTVDMIFRIGPDVTQVFDFDSGAESKWVGHSPTAEFYFQIFDDISASAIIIALDNSSMVASDLNMAQDQKRTIGIDLGRNSMLQLNGGVSVFDGLATALESNQFSQISIQGATTISNCTNGLHSLSGGTIKYRNDLVTFSGNTNDTVDDSATNMSVVGGGP